MSAGVSDLPEGILRDRVVAGIDKQRGRVYSRPTGMGSLGQHSRKRVDSIIAQIQPQLVVHVGRGVFNGASGLFGQYPVVIRRKG